VARVKRGYSENENGDVVLTMTRDDFKVIIRALGFYTFQVDRGPDGVYQRIALPEVFELVNRINEGNPHFRPYEIPE
jgi:hypothetical protein